MEKIMRKRLILLLTFVLALTVSIAVLAGCASKVTVEISRVTLEIYTGRSSTLTATSSNGSEIIWASSDETVATVDNGKVTGKKAGTATITASAAKGKGQAICEVTVKDPVIFTFTDVDGNTITEAEVDRDGTFQLNVSVSDGSTVTGWTSSNERVATVSSTGLVSGLFDGEAVITARTATGSGEIAFEVVDRFEGEKYTITGQGYAGEWWYQFSDRDNRSHEVYIAEYRGGVITFDFGGNVNWANGDVKLNLNKSDNNEEGDKVIDGWAVVTGKINSSVDGTVTIFDTEVQIQQGENTFEVYYNQADEGYKFAFSPNNDIAEGKFVISELEWDNFTPVQLQIPSFTVSGNTVSITDTVNEKGVRSYSIGFFENETDAEPVYVQSDFTRDGGDIDPAVGETGDYILKIMAVGITGFKNTGWSTDSVKYHLDASKAVYDLERTATPSSTRWVYYTVEEGDYASMKEATYNAGVITYKSDYLGWKFDSTQMYRRFSQFKAGVELELIMKVYCNVSGEILIAGDIVKLTAGKTTDVLVYVTQPATGATVSIFFGNPSVENAKNWDNYDETGIEFTFEVVSIGTYVPQTLETPSATFVAATDTSSAKIQIKDNNKPVTVKKYELGFFDENNKLVRKLSLKSEDGSFSDKSIPDGTYTLKVHALSAKKGYYDSDWSAAITSYTVANGGISYDLIDEARTEPQDDGIWWYWADPEGWVGAWVTVTQATYDKGTVTLSFTSDGKSDYGLQVKYNNPEYVDGYIYKLDLLADADMDVQVESGAAVVTHLKAGEKQTVFGGRDASFYLQVNIDNKVGGTLTISNVVWEQMVPVNLTAPSISVDGSGVVSITDTNAKGVKGYEVSFYKDNKLVGTAPVVNGEPLDVSRLAAGEYTLKIKAKATALPYYDSDLSAGITYDVVKEGGVKYELGMDDPGTGAWYYWGAIVGDWSEWTTWITEVKTAEYDNGNVTVAVTTTGEKVCPWGIQIKYRAPQAITEGTFNVTANTDCTIEFAGSRYNLKAGEAQELTFSGTDFYLQVNIKGEMDLSLTLSDLSWEN